MWVVYAYVAANPHNYDGGKHKNIMEVYQDKPTAERRALHLAETNKNVVYATFYKEEDE